jgi:aminopeptidase N
MPKPFVLPGTQTHFAPDCPVSVTHLRLELEPDLQAQTLVGRATLALQSRRDDLGAIELDAIDMRFASITIDGVAAPATSYDDKRLRIQLDRPRKRDEKMTIAIDYRCKPVRGLYFVQPDEAHPGRPRECWTQGQDEDSRFYFPCVDAPLMKSSSEILCTAPADLFVLSNGDLHERRDLGNGKALWHYVLDFPHSPYLVTLVCGEFCEIKDRAPKTGVEVYYYGPKGREADLARSLAATPELIDFFSKTIGVTYPFKRYSQIFVSDFIFGGMENTTATTLTAEAMLDERAAIDRDIDYLVAHELAHQWWGDLVTCREWPEAWLNEGFATYFEYIWRTHSRGRDEADIDLLTDLEGYLDEANEYQRPIVCRQFEEPIDLFDRHLYEKGGRVLHMLRHELGDADFFRTLQLYAERHARKSVETRDLARAVEEARSRVHVAVGRGQEGWIAAGRAKAGMRTHVRAAHLCALRSRRQRARRDHSHLPENAYLSVQARRRARANRLRSRRRLAKDDQVRQDSATVDSPARESAACSRPRARGARAGRQAG